MRDASRQERDALGTADSEVRREPALGGRRLRAYVAALVLFPFVMMGGTLLWMSTGWYVRHAQYAYLPDMGYGVRLRGADCQVLVYGDSTALVGVMPKVIEQRTGLKTCNIAEVAGVQMVNGMMVPDTYLEHNRRPRYMVFLYTPEDLSNPPRWESVSAFEGILFRLQYRPDAAMARMMAEHPNEVMMEAELGFRMGVQRLFARPLTAEEREFRERNGGWMPEPGPALTHCTERGPERAPDPAWIEGLRAKYGADGTRVLIDVMPEPECDATRGFYDARLPARMIDNTLGTLPIGMYTATGRLHTNDAGSEAVTGAIAEQVLAAERAR